MLNPGDPAPPFEAQDHLGNRVTLDDFKGKKLVLWFYPKADTPGCTAEGCSFRDLSDDFAQKNAAIVGVSFDTPEENKAFAEKYGFSFPLLSDTSRQLGVAYGAADDTSASNAKRIGVVIDEAGKILAYYPAVDAKTFPAEVVQTL